MNRLRRGIGLTLLAVLALCAAAAFAGGFSADLAAIDLAAKSVLDAGNL